MNADAVMRAFVAVPLPEPARAALAQELARLQRTGARVGWVAPEHLHVTLLFLGSIFGAQVPALAGALDAAAKTGAPFTLALAGLGYFGAPRSPRVLWAGLSDPEGRLAALQGDLTQRVGALGFPAEQRPFHPHVTLGRVRPGGRAAWPALLAALETAPSGGYGAVAVERVLLMQSHLEAQGVRYTCLHEACL